MARYPDCDTCIKNTLQDRGRNCGMCDHDARSAYVANPLAKIRELDKRISELKNTRTVYAQELAVCHKLGISDKQLEPLGLYKS